MAVSEELKVIIKASADQAIKEFKKVDKAAGGVGTSMKKIFGAAAILAGAKILTTQLVKFTVAASDAQETAQKFSVVFSGFGAEAGAAALALAEGYGIANEESQNLLSSTADLLQGFGVTKDASLELSFRTQQLAADLASFSNIEGGAKAASDALTKGLLGEREAMKALGIAITETELKKFAEEQGFVYKEMTKAEKAVVTLDLAYKQSANAIGDFARSSDSLANQMRIAEAQVKDLKVEIGEGLIPVATKAVTKFNELIASIIEAREESQKLKSAAELLEEAFDAFANGSATNGQKLLVLEDNLEKAKAKSLQLIPAAISLTEAIAMQEQALISMGRSADDASKTDKLRLQELLNANTANGQVIRTTQSRIDGLRAEIAALEDAAEAETEETEAVIDNATATVDAIRLKEEAYKSMAAARKEAEAIKEDARESAFLANIAEEWAARAETQRIIEEYRATNEAAEAAAHELKMSNMQEAFDLYGSYAQGSQQIFANLINSMMAGDAEMTDKRKKAVIALFRMQQVASIGEIAMNTASAIVEALPNIPLSIAVGAIGASQIVAAAAAKPPVKLAEGGIVMPSAGGTSAILGEAGQPEAVIPLDRFGSLGTTNNFYISGVVGSIEDVAIKINEGLDSARHMGKVA